MSSGRVAIAGKGGAGKTTISATVARLVARSGRDTLVIDGDSNPNAAVALGVDPNAASRVPVLPATLLTRRIGSPTRLVQPVEEVLDRHAVRGPDGVRIAVMGHPLHADEGCMCSAHAVVSGLLADVSDDPDRMVIIDMEASPEHFGRGTTRHADTIWLVVEPYYRSLETARRMADLARELPVQRVAVIANKIRSTEDADAISAFCAGHDLPIDAHLPWSDGVLDADRAGVPVLDLHPGDPYVAAVADLVRHRLLTPV